MQSKYIKIKKERKTKMYLLARFKPLHWGNPQGKWQPTKTGCESLTKVRYTGDTVLITDTERNLQEIIEKVIQEGGMKSVTFNNMKDIM